MAERLGIHLRRAGFVALNVWLVLHLVAVVAAPAAMPPSSETVRAVRRAARPYLQALYLDHGYHFFAPEPGAGHLIAWTVEREDGSSVSGRFPDRGTWPRLLYHRHFMLAEQLETVPPDLREAWHRSFANHLCHEHGGVRAGLSRIHHYLPSAEMVRDGVTLDAPESYVEEPLGVFECETPSSG